MLGDVRRLGRKEDVHGEMEMEMEMWGWID
jgi:hypothetical protein